MKKILKTSLIGILLFTFLLGMFQVVSNASGYSTQMSTLITDSDSATDSTGTVTKVNSVTATIITAIRIIGVAVAVVMLLTVAMKYMTAAPGDKADIKKSAIQYVVGAIVLFGTVGLLEIISKFASGIK